MKVSDRAEYLGSGLLHKGLNPNADTFIGIFAQNRPEVSVDIYLPKGEVLAFGDTNML